MSRLTIRVFTLLLLPVLVLVACNLPTSEQQPTDSRAGALYTSAAQTVSAQLTQINQPPVTAVSTAGEGAPAATPVPLDTLAPTSQLPVGTLQPTATAQPSATNPPTATPLPCDLARFVEDVSIPDDTAMVPRQTFVKTWRVRNAGACTWTSGYALVFDGGDAMSAPALVALSGNVEPGKTVDLSVTLTAPDTAGTYRGNWKLRNSSGVLFGLGDGTKPFWVQIKVTVNTGLLYDFLVNASDGKWMSGSGVTLDTDLAFGGVDDDPNGVVKIKDAVRLETGATSGKVLLMYPKHVENGFVWGVFPAYKVQSGDHFRAKLGFIMNSGDVCGTGKVRYQFTARADGGDAKLLGEWIDTCDGDFVDVDIDLSSLSGKSVLFGFIVKAEGSFQDDWAIWNSPRIEQ